ncbi:Hypothetical predicted protein [Olea europaea subsp. europaea]|uniref:PH domain-containing protein n=3 Tax=Olea europaea subsp. europaea TaxID=158383 RepID=A0A8S0UYR0_OLEEU|nr:Hypothetical predicted protein [Olea europaea subsp. europaea]
MFPMSVLSSGVGIFMGDGPRGVKVISDHFSSSTSTANSLPSPTSSVTDITTNSDLRSNSWARRKLKSAASMLNLFSLKRLSWGSGADGQEKVVLSAVEVESLRSEIVALEERESHYKAQLEHLDEILRYARLSSYLYIRSRWEALPGEPPPLDDAEVDDWLPRFVVLQGSYIYLFLSSADLSPQDSTLLSDIVEVDSLPCFTREDEETRYCFYILTRHGLRYECSNVSKIQVDSWVAALKIDCKLGSDAKDINDTIMM